MIFRQFYDPESSTYTYLIADGKTKEAVLVDPVLEQVERDLKLIQELGLTLRYCLETHIHADHITGTGKLRELTNCEGIVPEKAQAACANRFIRGAYGFYHWRRKAIQPSVCRERSDEFYRTNE